MLKKIIALLLTLSILLMSLSAAYYVFVYLPKTSQKEQETQQKARIQNDIEKERKECLDLAAERIKNIDGQTLGNTKLTWYVNEKAADYYPDTDRCLFYHKDLLLSEKQNGEKELLTSHTIEELLPLGEHETIAWYQVRTLHGIGTKLLDRTVTGDEKRFLETHAELGF